MNQTGALLSIAVICLTGVMSIASNDKVNLPVDPSSCERLLGNDNNTTLETSLEKPDVTKSTLLELFKSPPAVKTILNQYKLMRARQNLASAQEKRRRIVDGNPPQFGGSTNHLFHMGLTVSKDPILFTLLQPMRDNLWPKTWGTTYLVAYDLNSGNRLVVRTEDLSLSRSQLLSVSDSSLFLLNAGSVSRIIRPAFNLSDMSQVIKHSDPLKDSYIAAHIKTDAEYLELLNGIAVRHSTELLNFRERAPQFFNIDEVNKKFYFVLKPGETIQHDSIQSVLKPGQIMEHESGLFEYDLASGQIRFLFYDPDMVAPYERPLGTSVLAGNRLFIFSRTKAWIHNISSGETKMFHDFIPLQKFKETDGRPVVEGAVNSATYSDIHHRLIVVSDARIFTIDPETFKIESTTFVQNSGGPIQNILWDGHDLITLATYYRGLLTINWDDLQKPILDIPRS